jgi:hypothetical protein
VTTQGYWVVDVLRSPALELSSCFFDGKILRRGRIYYVDGFGGEDGAWIEKPETFRTWARRVRAAIRKALARQGDFDDIGPDARAWLEREHRRLES